MIKESPNDVCRNQCGNCRGGFVSGLGRATSSPLAQLGVLLTACHMLEGVRAQLLFSSSFSWFLPEETSAKGISSPRVKILYVHGRVLKLQHMEKCMFPGKLKLVRTAEKVA